MKYEDYRRNTNEEQVGNFIRVCLKEMGLIRGWNENKVFMAWDELSGAEQYTSKQSMSNGTLYIQLSSAVVRNKLYCRIEELKALINNHLASDECYYGEPIKRIVLK